MNKKYAPSFIEKLLLSLQYSRQSSESHVHMVNLALHCNKISMWSSQASCLFLDSLGCFKNSKKQGHFSICIICQASHLHTKWGRKQFLRKHEELQPLLLQITLTSSIITSHENHPCVLYLLCYEKMMSLSLKNKATMCPGF